MKLVANLGGIFVLVFLKIHHATPVQLYQFYSDAIFQMQIFCRLSPDRSFKLIVTWVASLFSKVVEYWVDQSTFGSFRVQIHKIPHFFYFQLPKPLNPRVTSKHPIITQTSSKHQSCNLQQKTYPCLGSFGSF